MNWIPIMRLPDGVTVEMRVPAVLMNWIPIMRLPDGVTVEMRVPAANTDCRPDLHCYRVREPDRPATELLTLRDVAAHLHAHCRPEVLDEICIGHHRDVGDHRSEP